MERAGRSDFGSITGLYTVLVEGDDLNEPVSDAARGILDGHIILSRKLANKGHYPSIDILESVSRVKNDVITPAHNEAAMKVKELMAVYKEAEDLISVGAYKPGINPKLDRAVKNMDEINQFLRQRTHDVSNYDETVEMLENIANKT
jgi:flagellum-specific ATP synthase